MKNKLITIFVFLLGLFACCACTESEKENDIVDTSEQLQIFRTDLELTQDQKLSQIKKEHLIENKGYLDSDEVVIVINLKNAPLIETYNKKYSNTISSVSEYAKSVQGVTETSKIKQEQASIIAELLQKGLIKEVENTYSTIMNAVAVRTTYANFKLISKMSNVSSVILSDTYNLPKSDSEASKDASAIVNDVDIYETGIYKSDSVSYTGKGTAVAVLDSGFDCSHTVFQHELDNVLITYEDVEKVLSSTNAANGFYRGTSKLKTTDVYYNSKIPFVYDYADKDYDVFPYDSNHGTHVAGIIGGKDNYITGIAVDTQLVLLKVFPDLDAGGDTEDILAALEDAVLLGVDAINMSLGQSCGFAREVDEVQINEVYDRINESGISLITAASNSYSSAYGGEQGNTNKVTNPDSGTVGSPSTYEAALSVASISGTKSRYMIGNDSTVVFYSESNAITGKPNDFYKELYASLGKSEDETFTLEYVTIPGVGLEVNYMNLGDLSGKIALVKRGDNTFEEKARIAKDAGAVACIIYNNIEGEILMSMGKSDHIPTISISKDLGSILSSSKSGTLEFSMKYQAGPFMSDFSSWGPTPSLGIKPEITAHGGNITSSVPGGGYDEISGTSMATPNLCGIVVLIRQYLKEEYPDLTTKEISVMANQLLMSTAGIILNEDGNPYSPRKQGAGLASLYNAVNTDAYITVDGIDKTKIELLDDPNRLGIYEMEFNLVNLSLQPVKYNISLVGMTESVAVSNEEFVAERPQLLTDEFNVEVISGGELSGTTIRVQGRETCKIKVTYTLTQENKDLIESLFPFGMYVEGFIKLEDLNTKPLNDKKVDLNVPFLAYYGDWTQAPIFDKTYYEVESEAHDASIDYEDKIKADYYATTPYGSYYYNYIIPLGTYLYDIDLNKYDAIPAKPEHIAMSNYLGTIDGINSVYAGLLRNCKTMEFSIVDKVTGEVVWEHTDYNARKSYYGTAPYPYYEDLMLKPNELGLINNRQYTFTMEGKLDYKDGGTNSNARNTFSFDFYLDDEAPILKNVEYTKEYDKSTREYRYYLTMTVFDNHYAQSITPIIFTSSSTYTFLTDNPIPIYSEFGKDTKVKFEITDFLDDIYSDSIVKSALAFSIDDYALNSDIYICQLPGTKGEFKFTKDGTPEGTDLIILTANENEAIDLTKYLSTTDITTDVDKDYLKFLDWVSSNEEVAKVNEGIVTTLKPGKVTITARENLFGKQAVLILNVKEKNENSKDYNDDALITDDLEDATIEELRFSYFDTLFAYSRAAQTSQIGETGSRIYINSLPGGVSMYPGEQIELHYDFDPWYAIDNYNVKFVSKNPSVASVDENGKVIALKKGTAIIQLLVEGSNIMASLEVTVNSEFVIENRTLVAYKGLGGEVIIPDDEGILYIGAYAFCLYDTDMSIILTEEDYDANKIPAMNTSVTSVVIPEGVEEIQKYAFYNCTGLEKVVIPESCKFIREYAFYGDEDLKDINLNNIEMVGREAFKNCEKLELDNNELTKTYAIGRNAFENCKALVSLDLTSLRNSGKEIFKNCKNLKTVILNEYTKLSYAMFVGSGLETIDIYEKVEIPEYCFALCENLTLVNIFNSLVGIKEGAFSECPNLTRFNMYEEVGYIADEVFYNCTGLKSIILPNNEFTLGGYSFYMCESLEEIYFDQYTRITEINGSVFQDTNLTKFIVNPSNPYYTTLENDSLLVSKDLSTIIFAAPNGLNKDLTIPSVFTKIGEGAFTGTTIETITFQGNNLEIGAYAFANCENLKFIKFPSNPGLVIKEHAFNYTTSLQYIENLHFVREVGDYAFANSGVKEVNLGKNATYGEGAFFRSQVETVTIGANSSFGLGAFQECLYLQTVNMPTTDVKLGRGIFANSIQLANIDLSYVTEITEEAFYGCSSLVRLNLASAKVIGNYAFADCSKLYSINIPKVEIIGEGAFSRYSTYAGAPIFSSITLPDTLVTINDGAFLGCESLTEIVIPESVTHMGDYLFAYCVNLASVVLPTNIKTVGLYSFAGCSLLEEINLENIEVVKDFAFTSCNYLENIDLTNVVTIGEGAFADTNVSGKFELNRLESVGNYAFQGAQITNISAPKLISIGEAAFQNNTKLLSFTFARKLEYIGSLAFNGCESLSSFYTHDNKTNGVINDYAKLIDGVLYIYLSNGKLQLMSVPSSLDIHTLDVAEGTVRIDFYAGNANKNVQKIVLPDSLETIGNYAFNGYEKLKVVEFKSIKAPILESAYNSNAVLEETDPGYDIIHNQYELFGLELCYFTFIDLVGKNEPIDMILPVNKDITGYDSLVYYVYFGSVEDSERNTYFAKETSLINFVEYAEQIKSYEQITIAHADIVSKALTYLNAIEQDPTFFGYSKSYWNDLVETVESAYEVIKEIKINNSRKIVKDTNKLLLELPTEFSEDIVPLLDLIKENLTKFNDDEKSLVDLSNYNSLTEQYEEFLENNGDTPVIPIEPIIVKDPVVRIFTITSISLAGIIAVLTLVVSTIKMRRKNKGGK
ncbi:MAG: leucine-rich repeat protein [Bacilli bacterium]|nr:leucine-rich repeat protein [Bacilli bacterium]